MKSIFLVASTILLSLNCLASNPTQNIPQVENIKNVSDENHLSLKNKLQTLGSDTALELNASKVFISVVNSKNALILAATTTSPNINAQEEILQYTYEPGSIVMPLVYAMAIDHNKTTPNELINGYQGRYNIENKIITDAFPFDRLRAEDVVVFSSNIGIAQIAQKLGGIELYIGLKKFGLGDYSTISDYHENIGNIPSLYKLERPVYQATSAYGYGFSSNLMQIMRAYSVFTNQGVIITPSTFLNYDEGTKVLSNKTVETVNTALVESVQKGLAQAAQVEGLEIGGKTGMSHMIANGLYINHYHNSFVGYANDSNNSYIIGVLIVDPKTKIMSSQTAAPLFKKCVETLISEKYLFPKQSLNH